MKNKEIDRKLRSMEAAQTTMPPAGVWNDVSQQMRPKRGRKGAIIILVLLMAGASVAYVNWNDDIDSEHTIGAVETSALSSLKEEIELGSQSTETIQQQANTTVQESKSNSSTFELGSNLITNAAFHHLEQSDLAVTQIRELATVQNQEVEIAEATTRNDVSLTEPEDNMKHESNHENGNEEPWNSHKSNHSNARKEVYFVEVGGMIGYHTKDFKQKNVWTDLRSTTETEWYDWGAYASGGLYLSERIYGLATLQFTQAKDGFRYERDSISSVVVEQDTSGSNITRTDSRYWLSEGEIRYTQVNGMVQLGVHLLEPDRSRWWDVQAEVGMVYNMMFEANGKVMLDEQTISRVEDQRLYRTSLAFGLAAQLPLEMRLGGGYTLRFKPYYTRFLSVWDAQEGSADMTVDQYGVMLGIKHNF